MGAGEYVKVSDTESSLESANSRTVQQWKPLVDQTDAE